MIQLRRFALVIILTRAGLEMDPNAFKRIYVTILKLGLVPWTVECVLCAVLSRYLLDLPWMWAFALGAIIAAVSPAVVVPCLFRLRTKGYGVAKGIPTLIVSYIYSFALHKLSITSARVLCAAWMSISCCLIMMDYLSPHHFQFKFIQQQKHIPQQNFKWQSIWNDFVYPVYYD